MHAFASVSALLATLAAFTLCAAAVNPEPRMATLLAKRESTSTQSMEPTPSTPTPSQTKRAVPTCYAVEGPEGSIPYKSYQDAGRGLQLLGKAEPVPCRDDGDCNDTFLHAGMEGGVTKTSCKIGDPNKKSDNPNEPLGVCTVECREGWTEYPTYPGHCAVSNPPIAFYDYCCGGALASKDGCLCPPDKGLEGNHCAK